MYLFGVEVKTQKVILVKASKSGTWNGSKKKSLRGRCWRIAAFNKSPQKVAGKLIICKTHYSHSLLKGFGRGYGKNKNLELS